MKKKYYLILGLITFFTFSAFTTYVVVNDEYLTSDITDFSFEERLVYHDSELYTLENYYRNVTNNLAVVNDYNSLMSDFEEIIFQQKEYMEDNNITYEQVRQNPSILPINFKITDQQYAKISNVINSTLPIASPYLEESLTTLEEYVDLVREVKYSKLEIFKDVTGNDLLTDGNGNSFRTAGAEEEDKRGLQSKEAVRKLRDLLNRKNSISEGQISVTPNPLKDTSVISFLTNVGGEVNFQVYDLNGRLMVSKTQIVEKGAQNINVKNIIRNDLKAGIYFLNVDSPDGNTLSIKILEN